MPNEKPKPPIILGAPERERNPLLKLVTGFCDPFIPRNKSSDDNDTIESHDDDDPPEQDVKERAIPAAFGNNNVPTTNNQSQRGADAGQSSSVRFVENLNINRSLHIPVRNMSELTIDTQDSTRVVHIMVDTPEIEVAKNVVRQRRQHALSIFFASLVFVMGALATLQKLGVGIADFHAPLTHSLLLPTSSSSSTWSPWIHIVDKTAKTTRDVSAETIDKTAETIDKATTTRDSAETIDKTTTTSTTTTIPDTHSSSTHEL